MRHGLKQMQQDGARLSRTRGARDLVRLGAETARLTMVSYHLSLFYGGGLLNKMHGNARGTSCTPLCACVCAKRMDLSPCTTLQGAKLGYSVSSHSCCCAAARIAASGASSSGWVSHATSSARSWAPSGGGRLESWRRMERLRESSAS